MADKQHGGRVWLVKTVNEQYALFKQSDVTESYVNRYPDFVISSRSTFIKYCCVCVLSPIIQLCVDICTSGIMHYIRALAKIVRKRRAIRSQLDACGRDQHKTDKTDQWQIFLPGQVEEFLEATCCPKVPYPDLKYGAGTSLRILKIFRWKCVNDECNDCGFERKIAIATCPIFSECDIMIDVLMWINVDRHALANRKIKYSA